LNDLFCERGEYLFLALAVTKENIDIYSALAVDINFRLQ